MTLPAPTRTMAEENAVERQIEKDAREIVWDRWREKPDFADRLTEWFAETPKHELDELAEFIFDVPYHALDCTDIGMRVYELFQRAKSEALRESEEVHKEADFLYWAEKNGL